MRSLYFLLPGTTGKYICGGLFAELKAFELARQVCEAQVVTYRQREADRLFLDDLLQEDPKALADRSIFVISWGFDVPELDKRLRGYPTVYHAHSANYGFRLSSRVPIITVSRNTMGYWGQQSPHSLIYYLPNQISDEFTNANRDDLRSVEDHRDIDVLVQVRKSSDYLLKQLAPALKQRCNVFILDQFVDDLAAVFQRSKVYLYDSAQYWTEQGVTEGFGLQPLEAMAAGCQVFSSVNHGLSDFLDPGFNCHKIAGYSLEYDVDRILHQVQNWQPCVLSEAQLAEYRAPNILSRWQKILPELNHYFDHAGRSQTLIPDLTRLRLLKSKGRSILGKVRKKLK
jgi:glycosyltransferase involved in cell wall biosynthesis